MDNREAGRYDSNIDNHPPTCTCAECTKRRLGRKQSIWSKVGNNLSFKRSEKPSLSPPEQTVTTENRKQALGWLLPAVLIFSCVLIGLGISLFIGTAIPLYVLLGFSLIFSIEKWLHFPTRTRKYKYIGKLYRLLLNLSILSTIGVIIWSGIKVFSQQYFSSSLVGSLVFLMELIFLVWLWRTVSKNSWRWPSMKLTVFSLVCLFLIFAFAGVPPISTYKDSLITSWNKFQADREDTGGSPSATESVRSDVELHDNRQPPYSKTFGVPIHLTNNHSATDPTWQELMNFLVADKTDQEDYSLFSYPCGAFAEEVHNNAEAAGIKAAWVAISFEDDSEEHALNAFDTVDRGLVYIDCTGATQLEKLQLIPVTRFVSGLGEITVLELDSPSSYDKVAYVVVGKKYGQISMDVAISPEYGFYETYIANEEEYIEEVAAYNQEATAYTSEVEVYNQEADAYIKALGGRIYLEEPEYSRFMTWESRLDITLTDLMAWKSKLDSRLVELEVMSTQLGGFYWGPLGVVSKLDIYW